MKFIEKLLTNSNDILYLRDIHLLDCCKRVYQKKLNPFKFKLTRNVL